MPVDVQKLVAKLRTAAEAIHAVHADLSQLVSEEHAAISDCWVAVSNILIESVLVANSMTDVATHLEQSRVRP